MKAKIIPKLIFGSKNYSLIHSLWRILNFSKFLIQIFQEKNFESKFFKKILKINPKIIVFHLFETQKMIDT